MYTFRPTLIQKLFYPQLQWNEKREGKFLYLTFDDGPDPEVTPWVLRKLAEYDAQATFFVVGENVEKYPELIDLVVNEEHAIGNHTYSHLNGWKTDLKKYVLDIEKCQLLLQGRGYSTDLFRPPYGRIKFSQLAGLKTYRKVMWSILSGDFDPALNQDRARRKLLSAKSGDIMLFHDTQKAQVNLMELLPVVLDFYAKKGFRFEPLKQMNDEFS
ncbi:polysaccharide deacetylase family protein [Marinoscillum sp. MHG1-6]|uniref:polysaccharide deacetylase family protein n=1 Tax=Marinoscillum sp. MHG1-6 TaxID=2959627 RepID=UPI0021585D39|nr:polysaccharide deacetylase family protein [Marinoscillum sp. MHG1-6]